MTSTAPSVISVGKKLLANMFRKSVIDVIDLFSLEMMVPVSSLSKYRCGSRSSFSK